MVRNPLDRWGTLYRVHNGVSIRQGFGKTSRILYAIFRGYEPGPLEKLSIRLLGGRVLRGDEIGAYARSNVKLWKLIRRQI